MGATSSVTSGFGRRLIAWNPAVMAMKLRCGMAAALTSPVVPDENCIAAGSAWRIRTSMDEKSDCSSGNRKDWNSAESNNTMVVLLILVSLEQEAEVVNMMEGLTRAIWWDIS